MSLISVSQFWGASNGAREIPRIFASSKLLRQKATITEFIDHSRWRGRWNLGLADENRGDLPTISPADSLKLLNSCIGACEITQLHLAALPPQQKGGGWNPLVCRFGA